MALPVHQNSWYQPIMKKSTKKPKKSPAKKARRAKTGRPKTTGAGQPMVVRMHEPQLKAIDGWIRDTGISRPEAIRQLVDWALVHVKPKEEPINVVKRAREAELRR